MLYKFLRQFFENEDQLKLEEKIINLEKEVSHLKFELSEKDTKKIDIEFISLLWTVIIITPALMVFMIQAVFEAIKKLQTIAFLSGVYTYLDYGLKLIVLILIFYVGSFSLNQIGFGIDLIKEYSEQKADNKYLLFAKNLRWIYIFFLVFLMLFISSK